MYKKTRDSKNFGMEVVLVSPYTRGEINKEPINIADN